MTTWNRSPTTLVIIFGELIKSATIPLLVPIFVPFRFPFAAIYLGGIFSNISMIALKVTLSTVISSRHLVQRATRTLVAMMQLYGFSVVANRRSAASRR